MDGQINSYSLSEIVGYIVPRIKFKVAGVELHFNWTYPDCRNFFLLRLWDVCFFGMSYNVNVVSELTGREDSYRFHFLGFCLEYSPNSGDNKFSLEWDKKNVAILIVLLFFFLMNIIEVGLPAVLTGFAPMLSELTLRFIALSYGAFVACIELVTWLENMVINCSKNKIYDIKAMLRPIFHYRIWLLLIISAAFILDFYPSYFAIALTAMTSILDVLFATKNGSLDSDSGIFTFNWDLLGGKMQFMGYHLLQTRVMFSILYMNMNFLKLSKLTAHFDLRVFLADENQPCADICRSYRAHLKPQTMGYSDSPSVQ